MNPRQVNRYRFIGSDFWPEVRRGLAALATVLLMGPAYASPHNPDTDWFRAAGYLDGEEARARRANFSRKKPTQPGTCASLNPWSRSGPLNPEACSKER